MTEQEIIMLANLLNRAPMNLAEQLFAQKSIETLMKDAQQRTAAARPTEHAVPGARPGVVAVDAK